MTTEIEVGSEWVSKHYPSIAASVVWADDKSVLFEDKCDLTRCVFSRERFLNTFTPILRTIRIGDYDVPEPLRVMPAEGTRVCFVTIDHDADFRPTSRRWDGDVYDMEMLRRGIIHLTEEAAELHAKALISLSEVK